MNIDFDRENIIALLGIESLPEERKFSLLQKVGDLVQARLLVRIFESVPAADREQLQNILDTDNGSGLPGFLKDHNINLSVWLEEELKGIKQEMGQMPGVEQGPDVT